MAPSHTDGGADTSSNQANHPNMTKSGANLPDYTTQDELDAFQQSVQLEQPYVQVLNCQVGLSATDFFESFLSDNATYPLDKFYISEGAKNVVVTSWKEP